MLVYKYDWNTISSLHIVCLFSLGFTWLFVLSYTLLQLYWLVIAFASSLGSSHRIKNRSLIKVYPILLYKDLFIFILFLVHTQCRISMIEFVIKVVIKFVREILNSICWIEYKILIHLIDFILCIIPRKVS